MKNGTLALAATALLSLGTAGMALADDYCTETPAAKGGTELTEDCSAATKIFKGSDAPEFEVCPVVKVGGTHITIYYGHTVHYSGELGCGEVSINVDTAERIVF